MSTWHKRCFKKVSKIKSLKEPIKVHNTWINGLHPSLFWNSLRPLYKKTDFFHKGSSELSVIMFMFRAMKRGENKFIITVKSFFFFKYICCHLWLQFGRQFAVGPCFPGELQFEPMEPMQECYVYTENRNKNEMWCTRSQPILQKKKKKKKEGKRRRKNTITA